MPRLIYTFIFQILPGLLVLISFKINAQQYNFRTYTADKGFPSSQPIDVFQDDKGFLWICTLGDGLTRFDGINFRRYGFQDSLISDNVRVINQDLEGTFWIGTDKGLCTFNGTVFHRISNKLLDNYSISDIYIDRSGKVWVASFENGLLKYDNKVARKFTEKEGLSEKKISCITGDKEGNIWIGTLGGGLIKYNGKTFKKYTTEHGLPDNTINSIVVNNDDVVWVGTNNGLSKVKDGVFSTYQTAQGIIHNSIYDLCEDKAGNLWIATFGGISKLKGDKFQNITTANGLISNLVYNISQDKEGNLWILTDLPGITTLGLHQISYFTEKTGLSHNSVNGIAKDDSGNIFLATSKGINIFNGSRFLPMNKEMEFQNSSEWLSLSKDVTGAFWLGGTNGILKYEENKFKRINDASINSPVFSITHDNTGETWIGSKDLINYSLEKGFQNFNEKFLSGNGVLTIFKDSNSKIWLGTSGEGAVYFDGENFTHVNKKNGIPSNTVNSIAEDLQGNIWLGTEGGGVCKLEVINGIFEAENIFDTRSGLAHNSVQSLIFDASGFLWVGTKNGICEINVPYYNKSKKKHITNYGRDEGFISVACNRNAVYKEEDGFLWFGTEGGAIRFNPATEYYYNKIPQTYISNIRLFYEDVNWKKYAKKLTPYFNLPSDLKLLHNNNYLTFDFIGINYSNPHKVKYQFRLIPVDDDWLPNTNKNDATYSNLSPGHYTFEVRATTNGSWLRPPSTFSFTILKPFWKTWWFFLAMILSTAGIVYAFLSSHTRTLKVIQKDLEIKVQQRTSQLEEQNNKLQEAYKIIEEKNSEITDSIRYAKNIQEAILPPMHLLKNFLPDSFVFFMPKDIVSGDFYWLTQTDTKVVVAAVDCTGHGVPGAFMSFVGFNLLNQIVNQAGITTPSDILNNLNISLNESLRNTLRRSDIKDGMDIAICTIDIKDKVAEYAGAYNPLYHIRDKQLKIYPADRFPVGSFMEMSHKKFTNHSIPLVPGDTFYIFTDGYSDQFGGPHDKKFMYSRFRNLLLNIQDLNMTEQKLVLYKEFQNWKGVNEQVDDILVIGIRV